MEGDRLILFSVYFLREVVNRDVILIATAGLPDNWISHGGKFLLPFYLQFCYLTPVVICTFTFCSLA